MKLDMIYLLNLFFQQSEASVSNTVGISYLFFSLNEVSVCFFVVVLFNVDSFTYFSF